MEGHIQKLCRLAQQADSAAAAELLGLFYKKIFYYLHRLTANSHDAEDLTQETFSALWASLATYKGKGTFSGWLHKIAYNKYLDWCRSKKKPSSCPQEWWQSLPDSNPSPLINAQDKQLAEKIYKAVEQLEEDKRQAVHLHYYQELSIKETAGALNVAASTVKYRLRQALEQLRNEVDTSAVLKTNDAQIQSQRNIQNA